jgi:hypothetical protein
MVAGEELGEFVANAAGSTRDQDRRHAGILAGNGSSRLFVAIPESGSGY